MGLLIRLSAPPVSSWMERATTKGEVLGLGFRINGDAFSCPHKRRPFSAEMMPVAQ